MRHVSPSVRETAFNCPHCGALAKQYWSSLHATRNVEKKPLPLIVGQEQHKEINLVDFKDDAEREDFLQLVDLMTDGRPFLWETKDRIYSRTRLHNIFISKCFNCKDVSIWIYDKLVYPQRGEAPLANADLPNDIRRDYDEASSILDLSPRGAAALIRLAIQKLCKELGQSGKNLNTDIGNLVENGLSKRVQQALDVVRVIGNNAVHPGQIDLRDDRAVAESLFGLLNLIAENMISEPRHVEEVYASLPKGALEEIEKRDAK